jgi:hypothetical protein
MGQEKDHRSSFRRQFKPLAKLSPSLVAPSCSESFMYNKYCLSRPPNEPGSSRYIIVSWELC